MKKIFRKNQNETELLVFNKMVLKIHKREKKKVEHVIQTETVTGCLWRDHYLNSDAQISLQFLEV